MILSSYLEGLIERLQNYLGGLNEVKAGLSFPKGVEKPEELILYEQITELGIPVVAGGIEDQPHIWLVICGVIRHELQVWNATSGAK